MAEEEPKSRPQPDSPSPSVYGGQWGESGKQNPKEKGEPDRPTRIKVPREGEGQGDESAVDTQSES
jgi:hypothetical protein